MELFVGFAQVLLGGLGTDLCLGHERLLRGRFNLEHRFAKGLNVGAYGGHYIVTGRATTSAKFLKMRLQNPLMRIAL
jgi:hypothetical protein